MQPTSPLPPLRLSAPGPSGRVDAAVTLSTVARLVASGAAVSKADLVAAAGLARTTVSTAVDELLARGVLRPDGARPTTGRGRPADRLAMSGRGGHVLLADLGARGAHLALVDLSQRVLAHGHIEIDVQDGPDAVLDAVEVGLDALRARTGTGDAAVRAVVRAVVIGLPGPVDGNLGIPVRPPIMPGWHAYPVSARLQRTFACPAVLENDVNLRALGEARALPADQAPLLFVKVGTGIGGGLVTREGVLHHGADGAAGDIGHVRVRGGPDVACACGNVGCIEAVASAGAIARRLGAQPDPNGEPTIEDLRALIARGDPDALGVVREAAGLIGELVATLVHFYNPARVTLGGSLSAASDELLAGVRSVVYQRALPLATRNLVLTNSVLGEYAGLAGAAVLGIERVLSPARHGRPDRTQALTVRPRRAGRRAGAPGARPPPAPPAPARRCAGRPARARPATAPHPPRSAGRRRRRTQQDLAALQDDQRAGPLPRAVRPPAARLDGDHPLVEARAQPAVQERHPGRIESVVGSRRTHHALRGTGGACSRSSTPVSERTRGSVVPTSRLSAARSAAPGTRPRRTSSRARARAAASSARDTPSSAAVSAADQCRTSRRISTVQCAPGSGPAARAAPDGASTGRRSW
jgi:predicted NBD/HSP70 family sugar kinase